MFLITDDPSSGSLVQYLAKIRRMVDTDVVGVMAAYVAITRGGCYGNICCHNTWWVLWQHMLP